MRVDQYLPSFRAHDAVSNHAREAGRVLRMAGFDSEIWAEAIDPRVRREANRWEPAPAPADPGRVALYHSVTGGDMGDWIAERAAGGQRTVVYHHGIIPPEYFAGWQPEAGRRMAEGRRQLAALAPHAVAAVAASAFCAADLVGLGYRSVTTCPPLVDVDSYEEAPDPAVANGLRHDRIHGGAEWLFAGRISPHRCHHDLVAAFAVFRRFYDPLARLTFVGETGAGEYRHLVHALADELEVGGAIRVLDGLRHDALLAYFQAADVFVCLSEYEGFGVPLLEAMALGVPVVAYAAAAVPETLGGAGVLLTGKDPLEVAAAVAGLLGDDRRRAAVVAAGRRRAEELALDRSSAVFLEALRPALDVPAPA